MSCPRCEHCQIAAFERAAGNVLKQVTIAAESAFIALICAEVASHYGLTMERLLGRSQTPRVTLPRMIGYWLSRKLTTLSTPLIAKCFGGRDHSTIVWGIQQVDRWMEERPMMASEVTKLSENLRRRKKTAPEIAVA